MSAPLTVRDPYSQAKLAELPWASEAQADTALANARAAFETWRRAPAFERSELLSALAARVESHREEFAELIRKEAGKPIRYARIEVERALGVLRWAAAEAPRHVGELLRLDASSGGREGYGIHARVPRGVILGITPFNFPLNLLVHKLAPALACGCAIVVKPSPATPLTALRLRELFVEVAGPARADLFQVLLADDALTARLTQAREVAMISFTGSAKVGSIIRRQAPEKPVTLELGGNAWAAVLADCDEADLAKIARRLVGAGFGYAGQSCISVQNIAVAARHARKLRELLASETEATIYGDPADAEVVSGPVIRASDAERVRKLLETAPKNARRVDARKRKGAEAASLVPPALIDLPGADALSFQGALVQEEAFGPLMTLREIPDGQAGIEALVATANRGRYGLQAGVFTRDLGAVQYLHRELDVGGLVVNDAPTTRYDHQPYGGVKDSGEGREGVRYAMDEMTVAKWMAVSAVIPG